HSSLWAEHQDRDLGIGEQAAARGLARRRGAQRQGRLEALADPRGAGHDPMGTVQGHGRTESSSITTAPRPEGPPIETSGGPTEGAMDQCRARSCITAASSRSFTYSRSYWPTAMRAARVIP